MTSRSCRSPAPSLTRCCSSPSTSPPSTTSKVRGVHHRQQELGALEARDQRGGGGRGPDEDPGEMAECIQNSFSLLTSVSRQSSLLPPEPEQVLSYLILSYLISSYLNRSGPGPLPLVRGKGEYFVEREEKCVFSRVSTGT